MANFGVCLTITNNTKREMSFDLSRSSTKDSEWGATPNSIKAGESAEVYINDNRFSIGAEGTATYYTYDGERTNSYYSFYGSCPVGDTSNGCSGPGLGSWNTGGHPLRAQFTVEGNTLPTSFEPVGFLQLQFPGVYKDLLAGGWKVSAGDRSALKDVQAGGAVHCVDGRKGVAGTDAKLMLGPKVQGATLGIVALAGDIKSGNTEGIQSAVKKIQAAGYIASVHGDTHNAHDGHPADGCGFAKKWYAGALASLKLKKLELSPDAARAVVEKSGGKFITLDGEHEEKSVRLNFVEGKTFEPDGTAFNLDVWFAAKMGIDAETLMRNAADTVFTLVGHAIPIQVVA